MASCLQGSCLPRSELDSLFEDVTEALDLALRGRVEEGWWCLRIGVERARALEMLAMPWSEELTERYQFALDQYECRFPKVSQSH